MNIFPFLRRAQAPNSDDFETLLRPYIDDLYRLAYRFCNNRDDAEDLVQDVLVKLYPRMSELGTVDELKPWLSKVLYRQFIDGRRRQIRSPIVLIEDLAAGADQDPHGDPGPEQQLVNEQGVARAQGALNALSEEHHVLIVLYEVEGYTLPEMAQLLDIPIGTVKSRLHRARTHLQKILAEGTF